MTTQKDRLTVTVDPDVIEAAAQAVDEGRAASVSSWVNEAMRAQAVTDQRLKALDEALASYEAEHGKITDEEIAAQRRSDRASAIVVRGKHGRSGRRGSGAGAA